MHWDWDGWYTLHGTQFNSTRVIIFCNVCMIGCLGVVLTIGVVSDLLFSSVAERVDLHVALARESPIIQHTELTLALTLL